MGTKQNTKRKKRNKYRVNTKKVQVLLIALAVLAAGLLIFLKDRQPSSAEPLPTQDGRVEVFNGESYVKVRLQEGVAKNELSREDFSEGEKGFPVYGGEDFKTLCGIDVSEHQGEIDWAAVAEKGVDFAILRAGGRFYGSGDMYSDDFFQRNFSEAKAHGIKLGVYYFSQAISVEEAREEARFCIDAIGEESLELPIFFDWEQITEDTARTENVSGETLTACAKEFCKTVEAAGFKGGVYLYSQTGYYMYELSELEDYTLWAAAPGSHPYFYYKHDIWQCSFKGDIPGIDGDCDLNLMFIEK